MSYTPIECHSYDYIEIACMRHYDLEITLLNHEIIIGQAKTTRVAHQEEFLIVKKDDTELEIRLDKIKSITIINNEAEFSSISFN